MRLRLPLIPFVVQFERRPLEPFRPRLSVRKLMAVVALLAVVMAAYVTFVELPSRRRRFRNAERAVGLQIDLLRRASAQERQRERAESKRAVMNREKAEDEEREAANWPEPSSERASHLAVAGLWAKAADGAMWGAERAAGRARQHQGVADALSVRRRRSGDSLAVLEPMAIAADTFLATPANDESFPSELAVARRVAQIEHQAMAGGRPSFPTVVGPRASAIEATAIWRAEQYLKSTKPGVSLKGCQVRVSRLTPEQPFWWKVEFIDAKAGRSYVVETSFSDSSVKDYLAKNP
jgi:hypothetical protein